MLRFAPALFVTFHGGGRHRMHTLFGHLGALYVLFRGRLKTSALTGRLLARYVPLRLKPSESVPRKRTYSAPRCPKSVCIRCLPPPVKSNEQGRGQKAAVRFSSFGQRLCRIFLFFLFLLPVNSAVLRYSAVIVLSARSALISSTVLSRSLTAP